MKIFNILFLKYFLIGVVIFCTINILKYYNVSLHEILIFLCYFLLFLLFLLCIGCMLIILIGIKYLYLFLIVKKEFY